MNAKFLITSFDDDVLGSFYEFLFNLPSDTKEVVLYINSSGGDIFCLLNMMDLMDAYRKDFGIKFITSASGQAMSSAALLLAYGDERWASKYTTILIHEANLDVSSQGNQDVKDLTQISSFLSRESDKLLYILLKRINYKGGLKKFKKNFATNRDWYLTPEEALSMNIIDFIGIKLHVDPIQD